MEATTSKRGRGRSRSFHYADHEFFKIFIPSRNSQKLMIPMAYVREFGETIPEKIILKGHDGKLWNVDIENSTNEGVFMKNGWFNFVSYYSLREGQFLVFKYIGDSTFLVKIFDINGVKIRAMPSPPKRIVREVNIEEESEEEESEEIEEDKKPFQMPSSSKQPRGPSKALKVSSRLEDPYFIKPVNLKQPHNLIIPAKMFTKHNIQVQPEMVLRNEKGQNWPVKVHECADGRIIFGGGWMKFWKGNNVRPCDACKFTFDKRRSSKVVKVEILSDQA